MATVKPSSPQLWFYILVASLPFDRIPSTEVAGLRLRPSIVLAGIFIALVFIKDPKFWWPKTLTIKLLYTFLGVCLLSALLSPYRLHGLLITAYTSFVVLVALASAWTVKYIRLRILLLTFLISAGVVCLFGLYQFFGDLRGLPQSLTGLMTMYSSQVFVGFPRIQAASLEPLYFANYLMLPLSVLIGIGALTTGSWIFGLVASVSFLLTLSRGGVGALVVVALLWTAYFFSKHRWRRLVVLGVVSIIAVFITLAILAEVPALKHTRSSAFSAINAYTDQVTNYQVGNSKVDRAYTRNAALKAFKNRPVLGYGPGNYGRYLHQVNPSYPKSQITNNEPTELLAETGLLGLLAFLAFALSLLARTLPALWKSASLTGQAGLAALFYLAGVAVQYYSFSTLYIIHIWLAVGLLVGLSEMVRAGKEAKV